MRIKKISSVAYLLLLISVPLVVKGKPLQFHDNSKSAGPRTEEAFLNLMSAHYEYGIKLGSLGALKSRLPQVYEEAKRVLRKQNNELAEIKALDKKYSSEIKNVQNPKPKDHTPDLEKLKGKEFEEKFILRMAFHFEDGVGLLKNAMPSLKGKNYQALAKKLLESQSESAKRFSELETEFHKN